MNEKGQALVEMAIVLILLFLLVFGIFQFGWLMYIKNTLNNAARAGARAAIVTSGISYGSAHPTSDCSFSNTDPNSNVYTTVCKSLPTGIPKNNNVTMNIQWTDLSVPADGKLNSGDLVTVSVTYDNIGSFANFIPAVTKLQGTASMRYEQ